MSHTSQGRSLVLATLLAVAAPAATALGLGEAQLNSALGEPLDLVITLTAGPDESIGPECFYLPRPLPGALPSVTRAQFTLENGPKLRVRTPQPLNEPAMILRMHASCPGGGLIAREYPLLLDPRPVEAVVPPAPARPAPPARAASPATIPRSDLGDAPRLRALAGDTLLGIASAVYPKNRRARDAYVAALRETNPDLAGLASDEAIPPETAVALPDLRRFAQRTAAAAPRGAPAAAPKKAPREKAARERAPPEAEPAPRPRKAPAPRARGASRSPDGFVLRLSSAEVDLRPSRDIDDRTRAQLRERLLLLDADDQVSALLQMRNSLRQLESRVADMQLRLANSLPSVASAPPPGTSPATPAPAPDARPAEPPVMPPVAAEGPKAQVPPAVTPPTAKPKPAPPPPAPPFRLPLWALIALAVAALGLVVLLVLRWRARRRLAIDTDLYADELARAAVTEEPRASRFLDPEGILPPEEHGRRAEVTSDAALTTNIPGDDPQRLRRRYLEERFPGIAGGIVDLADPDAVVKGARLFYEDGALPRAVELLQFAIEERPAQMKPWLALFEIFRLENLSGEFGALAARFKQHHGTTDSWRKVQFIGREIEPQNPLYADEAFNSLETIGYPNAAKTRAITFDPLAENWLNAPMDFTSDALAAELRRALLADAGIGESDLIPNPLPALKQVEIFNVA